MHAVEREDVSALIQLNKYNFNPNRTDSSGITPAMRAILMDSPEAFNAVVKNYYFSFAVKDKNGKSLLSYALESDNPEFAQILATVKDHDGLNVLQQALADNDTKSFNAFIQLDGIDINKPSEVTGETLLIQAIKQKNNDIVKILLAANADVTLKDKSGNSALGYAILNGDTKLFDAICQNKDIDVNEPIKCEIPVRNEKDTMFCEFPPLLIALENGYSDLVDRLMAKGADINQEYTSAYVGISRAPIIYHTAISGKEQAFSFLYKAKAKLTSDPEKAGPYCADTYKKMLDFLKDTPQGSSDTQKGRQAILKQMLEDDQPTQKIINSAQKDYRQITYWEYAIKQGKANDLINFIAKHGVRLDLCNAETGETLLMKLAQSSNNLNVEGYTAIKKLIDTYSKEDSPKARNLWNAKNKQGENLFMQAADFWDGKIFLDCLPYTDNINETNANGETAMMRLVSSAKNSIETQLNCLEAVLNRGANPNLQDKFGNTALHKAISSYEGDASVIAFLIKNGANPNQENKWGDTPLMKAVRKKCDADVIENLLKNDANPDVINQQGYSILFCAVRAGEAKTIELLLEHDADPNIQNNDGQTPLEQALASGNTEVVEMLLEYGADPDLVENVIKKAIAASKKYNNPELLNLILLSKPELNPKEERLLAGYQRLHGNLKETLRQQSEIADNAIFTTAKIDSTKKMIKQQKAPVTPVAYAQDTPIQKPESTIGDDTDTLPPRLKNKHKTID
mgnify:CR=1 FL=1